MGQLSAQDLGIISWLSLSSAQSFLHYRMPNTSLITFTGWEQRGRWCLLVLSHRSCKEGGRGKKSSHQIYPHLRRWHLAREGEGEKGKGGGRGGAVPPDATMCQKSNNPVRRMRSSGREERKERSSLDHRVATSIRSTGTYYSLSRPHSLPLVPSV